MIVDGAHIPSAISSAADNPIAVRKAISTFMSRHRASDDLEDLDTICVAERGPREGELKLWL